MALSPVLPLPFIPLLLPSLALPKRRAAGSDRCNTQIPHSPRTQYAHLLHAYLACHGSQLSLPLLEDKKKEKSAMRGDAGGLPPENNVHTWKENAPVACFPAAGSSPEQLFYPPWLQIWGKKKRKIQL